MRLFLHKFLGSLLLSASTVRRQYRQSLQCGGLIQRLVRTILGLFAVKVRVQRRPSLPPQLLNNIAHIYSLFISLVTTAMPLVDVDLLDLTL